MHFLEHEVKLRVGMRVADLGCGSSGHFVFPAAHLVGPDGMVHAVDILQHPLSVIMSRAKLEGITNVHTHRANIEHPNGVRLPDESVDAVLLCNILFQVKERQAVVQEAARITSPGGVVAVVEWKIAGAPFGPRGALRLDREHVEEYARGARLQWRRSFDAGPYHYGCILAK